MPKTLGREATLEESISRMEACLAALGFELEEVRWVNPVPYVWSVHLRDKAVSILQSIGSGSSPEAAKAGALGEFIERLATRQYFYRYYLGAVHADRRFVHDPRERWFDPLSSGLPDGLLDQHCRDHFDPKEELCGDQLIDFSSANERRGVCALPFERLSDGEVVWFPVNILDTLYKGNGCAVGMDGYEARVAALSEIFEHHIKATIISSGICLPRIPVKVLARYPRLESAIKALRAKGFVVDLRDASLGGKFPLICVSVFNRDTGGCLTAYGADPKFERALERALNSAMKLREIGDLDSLPMPVIEPPAFQWEDSADIDSTEVQPTPLDIFSDRSDYPFTEWNIEGDSEAEFNELCRRIHAVDMEIYVAQFNHLGVDCVQILVPGMSEVAPVDHLIWHNANLTSALRPLIAALGQLDEDELLDLEENLDQLTLNPATRLVDMLGIPAEPDLPRTEWMLIELRLRIALGAGELHRAERFVTEVLAHKDLRLGQRKAYHLLQQLIAIELNVERKQQAYERLLIAIHGEEPYKQARAALKGEGVFDSLLADLESLYRTPVYLGLMESYERVWLQAAQAATGR